MSSEFSSYFEEFLKDDINEFDIFKDDFSINESDGQQNGDDLQLQCRASSSFDLTISKDPEDPCPAINTANTTSQVEWAPWTLETLLPKTDWGNNNRQYGDESGVAKESVRLMMSPPPNNVLPSPCPWISCPVSPTIWTEARFTAHLEEHWADTLRRWSGPRKCDWLNCKSKATFKSPASLKSHILNIHVTPLVCTHPQCTYTKPFGKESDLSRHVETVHEKADRHKCPVELCEAHITGFARKDKLLNHIREQHDNLRCPFNHCFATVLEIQQESHLQRFHGSFECALGACETGLASCFLEANFRSHLRKHHNISYDAVLALMRTLRSTKDNTARGYHIVRLRKWQDCPVCSNVPSSGYVEDIQSHNE